MMKIVVSGGTGLIGRLLVQDMAGDGDDVFVLSRSLRKYSDMFGENVLLIYWDGRNAGDWVSHIDGADVVVNLAGESISGSGLRLGRIYTD